MIIKNITIENFQSYHESQTMDFSNGLNLIIGNGGKGKSKLFNAFYWVLFGKIYITGIGWCTTDSLPQSAKFAMQRYEFINKRALFKAQVNDEITASVQIEIEDDRGINYIIERSVSALRLDENEWDSDNAWQVRPNILKVSFDSNPGTKVLNDMMAEDKINELFPDGIRNYIWFQGESLESLINFRNKETLKAAVKHISYFPYYEKLSEIVEMALQKELLSLIQQGKYVVLDFSFWNKENREYYKRLIEKAGGTPELVYMKASKGTLQKRLYKRNQSLNANSPFIITNEILEHHYNDFQEPCGEGEKVILQEEDCVGAATDSLDHLW